MFLALPQDFFAMMCRGRSSWSSPPERLGFPASDDHS